jgi:hypothetical protein
VGRISARLSTRSSSISTPEERFRRLRVGFGDDSFELVGDSGEVGGRGRLGGLVGRLKREFGFLTAEVVEARLEARQSLFAAFR